MAKQIKVSQVASVLSQLKARQKNKCGICGQPFTKWDPACLDHNHKTGYIRGALHRSCNGIEGRVKKLAQRGHKGVGTDTYVIGLGKYLDHHSQPRINLIHPDHQDENTKRLARNKKAREARAKKKAK